MPRYWLVEDGLTTSSSGPMGIGVGDEEAMLPWSHVKNSGMADQKDSIGGIAGSWCPSMTSQSLSISSLNGWSHLIALLGDAAPYFGLRSCPSLDAWAMGHRPAVSRQGPGAGPMGGQALEVRVAVGPVGRGLAGPECEMDEAASARVGGGGQLWNAAVAVPSASRLRAAVERTRRCGPTIWPRVHLRCECALQMGCCVLGIYG